MSAPKSCLSDNKYGRRCDKEAQYPWRRPTHCPWHWRWGVKVYVPTEPRVKKYAPQPIAPDPVLAVRYLIQRIDKVMSATATRRQVASVRLKETENRRARLAKQISRGLCSRAGCQYIPTRPGGYCERHLAVARASNDLRHRTKKGYR